MSRKIVLVSCLLSTFMFSKTIEFEEMQKSPQRVSPSPQNEILSFNTSIKDSIKSVVNISAKRSINTNSNLPFPMLNDPFFKKFFGEDFSNQFKQNRIQNSLGSGVIVTKDGYIVTNNHVVENAEEIAVTISDDPTEYSAKLVGRDSDSDIAVIKIDTKKGLTPIKLGDSNSVSR